MAVKSVTELRAKFETGDVPTQQDFIDLIDSFYHVQNHNWPTVLPASSGAALTDLNITTDIQEYNPIAASPGFLANNQIAFTGDYTAILLPGIRVVLTLNSGDVYTEVLTAIHATGVTTVTLKDAVANSTISQVQVSIFKPTANGGALGMGALGITAFAQTLLDDVDAAAVRATINALQNVLTTRGDLLTAGASGMAQRLAKGTEGQVLIMGANDPSWTDLVTVPIGIPLPWLGDIVDIPSDYIAYDGSEVSRTTFASIFNIFGVTYGVGDGSTTFDLPDLTGQVLRGLDSTGAHDPDHASRTAPDGSATVVGAVGGSRQGHATETHAHTVPSRVLSGSPSTTDSSRSSLGDASVAIGTSMPTDNFGSSSETRMKNVGVIWIGRFR